MGEFWVPDDQTIHARIERYNSSKKCLYAEDKNGLICFAGGHQEEGETDLIGHTLEHELNEELVATLNPARFGDPAFRLNMVLAHTRPFMFCTAKNLATGEQVFVEDPYRFRKVHPQLTAQQIAAKQGYELALRIFVLLYEVSGNEPESTKSMRNACYGMLAHTDKRPMRVSVRKTLEATRWKPKPEPETGLKLDLDWMNHKFVKRGMCFNYARRLLGRQAQSQPSAREMQHQPHMA